VHTHSYTHLPFLWSLATTVELPHPANTSPWSVRASFTASFPFNTMVGFVPKHRVSTGM
jgi:hypothetical protein